MRCSVGPTTSTASQNNFVAVGCWRLTDLRQPDADKPAGGFDPAAAKVSATAIENHQLADLGADELCTMLIGAWEDDDLRELAKRITT